MQNPFAQGVSNKLHFPMFWCVVALLVIFPWLPQSSSHNQHSECKVLENIMHDARSLPNQYYRDVVEQYQLHNIHGTISRQYQDHYVVKYITIKDTTTSILSLEMDSNGLIKRARATSVRRNLNPVRKIKKARPPRMLRKISLLDRFFEQTTTELR